MMNAHRKLAGIIALGVLTCMVGAVAPASAQGHSGGGGGGGGHSSGGHSSGASGGHAHYAVGARAGGYAGGAHYAAAGYRGGAYYGHGGAYYGHGGYYGGGYWRGGFYGPRYGFGWFLPILPAFYSTYWFGGIPYYYANDAYYTWSPDYNGYVATDPPANAVPEDSGDSAAPPPSGGQTFNYPKNGQTDEQQASDRYQCHQWAVSQSGYDPTRNAAATAGQGDYRRAVTACMEGRGYTVR